MLPDQIKQVQEYLNWQLPYHKDLALTGEWKSLDRVTAMGWQTGRGMAPTGKAEDVWKYM